MRRGQGTVEFALMVPLLLAVLFLIIEFGIYFGAVHWDNYVAFSMARARQVGADASQVADMLLTGNVTKEAIATSTSNGATVYQPWDENYHLPGAKDLLGDMGFQVSVILGPPESGYEGAFNSSFADNNVR